MATTNALARSCSTSACSSGARILVVDDDLATRNLLHAVFDLEGYVVAGAEGLATARLHLLSHEVDLVVTDLRLGDGTGFDLLADRGGRPVLVLTSTDSIELRLRAFRMGADDYVTKPFLPDELAARVAAIFRRVDARPANETLGSDVLEIDLRSRIVTVDGLAVDTTAKEFDLLAFLAANPGTVYTRDQLLTAVWRSSSEWQKEETVTEHIRRLRRKLVNASRKEWLQTVRGVGYRFDRRAPVV